MAEVKIPFWETFKDDILSGVKDHTSRTRRYGRPGDTFEIFGKKFELIMVESVQLSYVREYRWKEEGCTSPDDFVRIWKEIHPRKGYDPDQYIWLHQWKPCD